MHEAAVSTIKVEVKFKVVRDFFLYIRLEIVVEFTLLLHGTKFSFQSSPGPMFINLGFKLEPRKTLGF